MPTDRPIVLLTRPERGSTRFAAQVAERFGDAVQVIQAPLHRIAWRDFQASGEALALIFTSENGILSWIRDETRPRGTAYCVGQRTAALANEHGFTAINAGGDAEALISKIIADNPSGPLLHVRGEIAQGDVAKRLSLAGIETSEVIAYAQIACDLTTQAQQALVGGSNVIAPLFSPRSAEVFQNALPQGATPWVAVISPKAGDRLDLMLQRRMMVADVPNGDGMLNAIAKILTQLAPT